MKNNNNNQKSDEVEQLLQAAHDEMLLKLSIDSHIANISSNYLNADLDRRFQALKSRPSVPQSTSISQSQPTPTPTPSKSQSQSDRNVNVDDELKTAIGDDLSARFAALKASSSSSSSSFTNDGNNNDGVATGHKIPDGDDGEDEVEKIIRWAKDAARLDPSPPSEDGDDTDQDSDHETASDEEPQRNKSRRK